ncbi:MAG: class I SAM-dependent rRNA methyltransferase [Thermodesulfovibrionales bacterium]|nr:class I SAM-dependent rRNA methyltransferase [Thermodesulfovibrionales bacterium]
MYERIVVKRTSRLKAGHQWVFSNEFKLDSKKIDPGSIVELYDSKNNFLGRGYFNPHSLISIRLLSKNREDINRDFFVKRIEKSINYRKELLPKRDACRVVFSEGDFLPGLIADKYSDFLVIQILTVGMEKMKDLFLEAFDDLLSPSTIILRNDSPMRKLEGLPLSIETIKEESKKLPLIGEGDLIFEVNPLSGQKTGFFLDHSDNRIAFSKYVNGGIGLDVFCYTGAWALHLAKRGAFVIGIDESEKAISQARRNAELNGLSANCQFFQQEAFEFLKRQVREGKEYDFIVLDPPAFVKSRQKIKEAIKGYRDLNYLALRLLRRGGVLATSSCSYHMDKVTFYEIIRTSAKDANKDLRVLEFRSQSVDHPILLSMPETEYLKCIFLKA